MAGITLAQAQTLLDAYVAAEIAVLSGQSYEIAGRKLTRADLATIIKGRELMATKVADLSAASGVGGRGRARTVVVGF